MYCLEQLWQRAYIAAIQTLSAYPGEEVEGLSFKQIALGAGRIADEGMEEYERRRDGAPAS